MTIENNNKNSIKYLRVIADMRPHSLIMPIKVIFNEKEFVIDEIFDIKKLVVSQIGELCSAYYCKFKRKIKILYLDKMYNWFVI